MMKKIALTLLLFLLTFGVAGAASVNGEFDGNPIVKLQSGGQELKVEDVPATIYKGRTVVPIYLLRQLGATVDWNADTYTVSVNLPQSSSASGSAAGSSTGTAASAGTSSSADQEQQTLRTAYEWLKDTDTAICMFVDELQQMSTLDSSDANTAMLNDDAKRLNDTFNDSLQMSLKVINQVQNYQDLRSITDSENKVMEQINNLKNLLLLKQSTGSADIAKSYGIAWLNTYRAAQQNLLHTSDIIHKLQ